MAASAGVPTENKPAKIHRHAPWNDKGGGRRIINMAQVLRCNGNPASIKIEWLHV